MEIIKIDRRLIILNALAFLYTILFINFPLTMLILAVINIYIYKNTSEPIKWEFVQPGNKLVSKFTITNNTVELEFDKRHFYFETEQQAIHRANLIRECLNLRSCN